MDNKSGLFIFTLVFVLLTILLPPTKTPPAENISTSGGLVNAPNKSAGEFRLTSPSSSNPLKLLRETPRLQSATKRGANGGFECATCVILLGLVERWAVYNNASVEQGLTSFCKLIPGKWVYLCRTVVYWFGKSIVRSLVSRHSPEAICHSLNICVMDDPSQPNCFLFHRPKSANQKKKRTPKHYQSFLQSKTSTRQVFHRLVSDLRLLGSPPNFEWSFCDLPYVRELCEEVIKIFTNHSVVSDSDRDFFSTQKTLRGSSWRGEDCDDNDASIYPGRIAASGDVEKDSNCNGIFGTNPVTGASYEDELCAGTARRGIVLLGDSAGAHFHMPESWFDPTQFQDKVLINGSFIIENEGDWPQLSSFTGFLPSTDFSSFIKGPVDSIYKRMKKRNRCNHRDFQNLAVNGAASEDTLINMKMLRRNQTRDHPLIVFYSLNGNDVCNWHRDTLPYMTTVKVMKENVLKTIEFLNSTVPAGSQLVIIGMPDGRFLWDNLHHRIHPLGRLWNDVTYGDVYNFWNCLEITPCFGWLNNNETARNLTQQRANNLTLALRETVEEQQGKWRNIEITMQESPLYDIAKEWIKVGGEGWQLIEAVDGFHPNQFGVALVGMYLWERIEKYSPHVLGEVNPFNDRILDLFGDQGGY